MIGIERMISGVVCAVGALLLPARPLLVCVGVFVALDFVLGIWASRARAVRENREWRFESRKAWRTVYKAVFAMLGICMAWTLDTLVLDFAQLHLAKIFTGFVCGVEFWSYLENAADISNLPIFKALKSLMKGKIEKTLNIDDTK